MNWSAFFHQLIRFTRLRSSTRMRVAFFWLLAIATFLVVLPSKAQSPGVMDNFSSPVPMLPASGERLPELPQNAVEFVTPQTNYNQTINQTPTGVSRQPQYWVIVNSSEPQLLMATKQIEPTAYFRSIQGRTIIQAGVFSTSVNADTRARQLVFMGIPAVQVINSQTGQIISYNPGNPNPPRPQPQPSQAYFVVIPGGREELPGIENKIRQNIGQNLNIMRRHQPRGWHVAVGPFRDRYEAEQWHRNLKNLGFGNARVYYGR
ncbi:SPOR domain-containing protein [Calothrix sp. NIES-3974]|uniref:SPOR domain-containing protein n=1 Tax=Calothrix sp. NIES-3974 TaxID=2005462 RepID=UPI000B5DEAC4|nr:hypothetical protein [Calothrix sp. NIES-3974]BAZ07164.1 hypothetical protein NIES3974_38270 [Calothrix sp. NIES-3974]